MELFSDGTALTRLQFSGQKHAALLPLHAEHNSRLPVFVQAAAWLDAYFAHAPLPALPPLRPQGTPFQTEVWRMLTAIPYGSTTTYKQLAHSVAHRQGRQIMSAQAIGGAVGRNPIGILIPCHRVVGTDGSLTGYAGGMERKAWLLQWEKGIGMRDE